MAKVKKRTGKRVVVTMLFCERLDSTTVYTQYLLVLPGYTFM